MAISQVGDPQAFDKGGAGPATVADLASQVAASLALRELCGPCARIVAEESWEEMEAHGAHTVVGAVVAAVKAAGFPCDERICEEVLRSARDEGGAEGTFWAIDPLDGTKGYLRGGQFAVAIALVHNGQPAVGVLAAPRLALRGAEAGAGVLFGAARGHGAWQAPLPEGDPQPIQCTPWSPGMPVRLAASVEKSHSAVDQVEAVVGRIGTVQAIRMDSQAKYGLVARGCADAYIRNSPTPGYVEHIWDHAAGALVAQEAGCTVTDLHGAPLAFHKGRGLHGNVGVLCAPPALHARLVAAFAHP